MDCARNKKHVCLSPSSFLNLKPTLSLHKLPGIRLAAVLTLITFLGTDATFASTLLKELKISSPHGTISEYYDAPDKKTGGLSVIHIQDAHASLEGQMQIKRIIEELAEEEGIRLVGIEGAMGPFPEYKKLQQFPIKEVREKVTQYYLERGLLSGAEQAKCTLYLHKTFHVNKIGTGLLQLN